MSEETFIQRLYDSYDDYTALKLYDRYYDKFRIFYTMEEYLRACEVMDYDMTIEEFIYSPYDTQYLKAALRRASA